MKKDVKNILFVAVAVVLLYYVLDCSGVLKKFKSGYKKPTNKEMYKKKLLEHYKKKNEHYKKKKLEKMGSKESYKKREMYKKKREGYCSGCA
jgi:hypothetical protein